MKKILLLTFISLFTVTGVISKPKKGDTKQIPILAWYGVSPKESTVERFIEQKESGVTHNFTFFPSVDELAVAMESAKEAGIKMIIHCPELEKEPEAIARRFKDHPALAGYFLKDEPGREAFPMLGEWARRIQSVDDEHFCYLNLFPNYAPLSALGTDSYREHVQLFIKEVPLPQISFDYYPIVVEGGKRIMRASWYDNLEVVADEAAKAGKPFWAFAMAVAHGPYPIPTMGELRVQMFSNLAYGAQGLQYFTYWTPSINEGFDFHHAPIDYDTKRRTEIYDFIKELNREIKNLSPVFLGSEVVSIAHTGDMIPDGTKRFTQVPSQIGKLQTEGLGAVVSQLENGDDVYLVIVNRDFQNTMKVTVDPQPGVNRVLKDGSSVPAQAYINDLTVEPGDILIYNWKK